MNTLTKPASPNDPLTADEVGVLLGISGSAVRQAIRQGRLRAERIGGGKGIYVVRRMDVDRIEYKRPSRRKVMLGNGLGGDEKTSGKSRNSG